MQPPICKYPLFTKTNECSILKTISPEKEAAPWGPGTLLALAVALLFGLAFDRYAAGRLGGLTGDLYGATEKLTETATLFTYWILIHLPQAQMLLGGWHF